MVPWRVGLLGGLAFGGSRPQYLALLMSSMLIGSMGSAGFRGAIVAVVGRVRPVGVGLGMGWPSTKD